MIRNKLHNGPDEFERVADLLKDSTLIKEFYNKLFGIRLIIFNHDKVKVIMFDVLMEDDGEWFGNSVMASSYWIPDFIEVLNAANDWMKLNCEPYIHDKKQYGYKVK